MDSLAFAVAVLLLALVIAALLRRRHELRSYRDNLAERTVARERGSHRARLQHPKIDLRNCIGCGACVRACPEDGVLALSFGQAVVVHGARCVGHGLCAAACPTEAIALTLGDLKERRDLPAIDEGLEAVGEPGLFLAGEITGFALVRTAVQHGVTVAREVARRCAEEPTPDPEVLDLLVVGLGPAGLSCLLGAREADLHCMGIDQAEEVGGTVAAYPRRKLVMTQPMDLPLHGRLKRLEYQKEELVGIWQGLVKKHRLPVQPATTFEGLEHHGDGTFTVTTSRGTLRARNVCLALGRRGSPRKLGVPGENLPKVAYSLLDAESYRGRRILVVGGGDSAIEAALALAEQEGNEVTLSYRQAAFSRLKARNESRIEDAVAQGHVRVLYRSTVREITAATVQLACKGHTGGAAVADGDDGGGGGVATAVDTLEIENDEVFVFAGGVPPFPLLEAAGVSFDPELRPAERVETDSGSGLLAALIGTVVGLLGLWLARELFADYYDLPAGMRASSEWHAWLRPQSFVGLTTGLAAAFLLVANLAYLLRRSLRLGRRLPGTLKTWMNVHVATGLAACLFAAFHSGFQMRNGAGGHALLAMIIVVAAGIVGRWFYAFVPRVQNGRQQNLEELQTQVAAIAGEWDEHGRGFGARVRQLVDRLVDSMQLGSGFFARVFGLLSSQMRLRRELRRLRVVGRAEGIPESEIANLTTLAQRSHRLALQLVHFEDVRGLLSTWRWIHRWLAILLTLLTVVHVVTAFRYGNIGGPR
ncbi:MAG: NAD(P)-binding domain-containing protein [Planctomycetes bacterium]|nr:NAD(P)-binding domain-containing protein [Planctomycetota bacterium]